MKTLVKKKSKDDTNRWICIPCSWMQRINIVENDYIPKIIYRFNSNPYQIIDGTFTQNQNKNSAIYVETPRPDNKDVEKQTGDQL